MANLKVTSYESAKRLFEGSVKAELKIGNNTIIYKGGYEKEYYIVALHGHDIVELHEDKVRFTLAGWPTVTTRERINQFLPPGAAVSQHDYEQYYNGEPIHSDEWYEWSLI